VAAPGPGRREAEQKFFWFFFFKKRTSFLSEDPLWAVVATTGRIVRIAEIFQNRAAALADQAWRESQVRAYAGFLESAAQPYPIYSIKPVRRSDLPRRWKPLPALGFLNGRM